MTCLAPSAGGCGPLPWRLSPPGSASQRLALRHCWPPRCSRVWPRSSLSSGWYPTHLTVDEGGSDRAFFGTEVSFLSLISHTHIKPLRTKLGPPPPHPTCYCHPCSLAWVNIFRLHAPANRTPRGRQHANRTRARCAHARNLGRHVAFRHVLRRVGDLTLCVHPRPRALR